MQSDFNLTTLSPKELIANLNATLEYGGNTFVVGARGSGKTLMCKEVIKKNDCEELYLNVSTFERPDFGGFPNFWGAKDGAKYIDYLMPHFYKRLIDGDKPVVVMLDEIDKADPSLLAPLLEFCQFASINGNKFKNLKAIFMTGNLPHEGGSRPPLPLLDRTEKYKIENNVDDWLEWGAATHEIHPSVSSFISDNRDMLLAGEDSDDLYADRSPRGWHNYSRMLFFGEKREWNPTILKQKAAGIVGKKASILYENYFDHYRVLIPLVNAVFDKQEKELKNFKSFEPGRQLVATFMVCERYSTVLDTRKKELEASLPRDQVSRKLREDMAETNELVVNFLVNYPEIESSMIGLRSHIGERIVQNGLILDPSWSSFLKKFKGKIG